MFFTSYEFLGFITVLFILYYVISFILLQGQIT